MAKKFSLKKKSSNLFQLTDKINSAEDFVQHKLDKHGSEIIINIPLTDIIVEDQVRKEFSEEAIHQLAQSIEKEGLLYPILVMAHPKEEKKYILLVGESRFRAFQQLNKKEIPARIKPYIENNGDRKLVQLTENIQRKNLNAIELADSFMAIKSNLNLTLEQLAQRVGRSLDTLKLYSRVFQLDHIEKEFHKNNNTGIKELRNFLKNKSVTVTPSKKTDQLSLFKETKTSLKLSSFSLNFKKESKEDLEKKISECEQFLRLAKKRISTL
tara:strand:- start:645 stop:1451 length:807 start_codon:yes stop_codon:yes gene_type:complete